jgi:hypothetical protein
MNYCLTTVIQKQPSNTCGYCTITLTYCLINFIPVRFYMADPGGRTV